MRAGQLALWPSAATHWARLWRRWSRLSPQQQWLSPRCSLRAAVVIDESAQLLQLDPERNVTFHSCGELRYIRATAAERQSILVLKLFHAVHILLTRAPHVLCTQQHSELLSGHNVRQVMMILKLTFAVLLIARWMHKERAQSFGLRPRNQIGRVPSVAFIRLQRCGSRQPISPLVRSCVRRS